MTGDRELVVGDAWGDDISRERQAELEQQLQAWEREIDHGGRKGPFEGISLSGADVFWLAARTLAGTCEGQAIAERIAQLQRARDDDILSVGLNLSALSLTGANLRGANLAGAILGKATFTGASLLLANLAGAVLFGTNLSRAVLSGANLAGASLVQGHLEAANLGRTNLEAVNLDRANLVGAELREANLSRANLRGANLSRTSLGGAVLTGANLGGATLAGADVHEAILFEAYLFNANLAGADLVGAELSRAILTGANLAGANLAGANLSMADLRESRLSVETILAGANLSMSTLSTATLLADVVWNNAPLARVAWEAMPVIGDEMQARQRDENGEKKGAATRCGEYEAAARAYRLLAVSLRGQGLNEHADRYAYRAQLMQRVALRHQHAYLRYAGSLILGLLAGYGYRLLRTLFWYLAVIASFAFAYFQATHGALTFGLPRSQIQPLAWYEALVLSVSSFHGRGFFQPVQSLGDPVAILAAIEAVFGLFIEISFIATFTQRYFGK